MIKYILLLLISLHAEASQYPEFLPRNIDKKLTPYLQDAKQYFRANDQELQNIKQDSNKPKLLLFISNSMPKKMLDQYALDIKKAGGILVLRGFIDNDLSKTIFFIKSLNKAGVNAVISPHGFDQLNITAVPTIAVISNQTECYLSNCNQTPLYDKISGSITVSYALRQIAQNGEHSHSEAELFLAKLEQ